MAEEKPATWKLVVAGILDFLLVFLVGGYLIAALTGNTTSGGFELNGWPALLLFALIAAYFFLMPKLGGTLFRRLFGVA
jgi:uncharacterized membrane protein YoaK (UPF0700 family)